MRPYRHRLLPIATIMTILALFVGCGDDEPERKPYVDPEATEVRTEPAEFRMNVDDEIELDAVDEEDGRDTVRLRGPDGEPRPYSVESLRIVFAVKGDRTGRIEHIFDDFGLYEWRRDSLVDPEGNTVSNTVAITTPERSGLLYADEKKGWRAPNRSMLAYLGSFERREMNPFAFNMEQLEAERVGDTVIAGYQTRIYRIDMGSMIQTLWIWRDFPIRVHYFMPYDEIEYRFEPVEIERNPKIGSNRFEWPEDYTVDDLPSPPEPGIAPPPPPGSPIKE